jgi:hypothetical protein
MNSDWILTKQRIIEKVYQLFGSLSLEMQSSIMRMQRLLPAEILQSSPKISKGEQYEALPYVVLDYPRCFSKEHVFAIRTFFWWGNYFSISLHLKGKYQQQFARKIEQAIKEKKMEGYYVSFSGDEFGFNLQHKNCFLIDNETPIASKEVTEGVFFKISNKISFEEWNAVSDKLTACFLHFMNVLAV